ncbi:tRNA (guanosine(37)-N1)-methyltransferase TrmD [uncultured Actinomyces sp.]|uniref:tRNA (guanosine(37)-N1)-methyltransferase TrmD n=1 Tax=uncultured Actinomyces sp. TaxID=249061 RepID=UPI0028EFA8A2|nr:tRNA (guanosine(37)-N1)-methyltransferase TrmD [uncultured Actinomyces sp.]
MRFDLISIFPDYFTPLTLSLMGKAEDAGLVTLAAHDLRQWATGKHRSVDDTPYGGGAGMVMRADVWARALDDALATPLACENEEAATASCRRVLAIPTPSGTPLTQPVVEDLARADQIIVACGRYEGIDARVAQHYRAAGVEVLEFSIGDYVLNGGEVAAMVLTEAVARLLDGFMGNPDSLVEESHSGAGLLEYPVFTKPRDFRSLEIPEVLLGGNHAAIERWRRDRAIEKTVAVRPDLALSLDAAALSGDDRATLAACGVAYPRAGAAERLTVRQAELEDVVAVSELAARTFPDACPQDLPREAIDEHIATQLSADVFDSLISDPERHRLFVAEVWGGLVGYVLTHVGPDALPSDLVRPGRVDVGNAYLSKCYVDAAWRGSGIADVLLERAVADAAKAGHRAIVLGTNRGNKAAQAFYKKHGFRKRSTRTFDVGGVANYDVVMVRDLTPTGGATLA